MEEEKKPECSHMHFHKIALRFCITFHILFLNNFWTIWPTNICLVPKCADFNDVCSYAKHLFHFLSWMLSTQWIQQKQNDKNRFFHMVHSRFDMSQLIFHNFWTDRARKLGLSSKDASFRTTSGSIFTCFRFFHPKLVSKEKPWVRLFRCVLASL